MALLYAPREKAFWFLVKLKMSDFGAVFELHNNNFSIFNTHIQDIKFDDNFIANKMVYLFFLVNVYLFIYW